MEKKHYPKTKRRLRFSFRNHLIKRFQIKPQWLDSIAERKEKLFLERTISVKGKKRRVHIAHFPLNIVQKRIHKEFSNMYFPKCFMGGMRGYSIVDNAYQHRGKRYVMNLDLKDFFPSLNPSHIRKAFISLECSNPMADLMTYLVTANGHLPQGFSTSPLVSTFVLIPFAKELEEILKPHGMKFTIWIDDITISSNRDPSFLIPQIDSLCKKHKLKLNHGANKLRIAERGKLQQFVTGVVIDGKNLRPSGQFSKDTKKMAYLRKKYNWEIPNSLFEMGCNNRVEFTDKLKGRISFIRQFDPRLADKLLSNI